MKRLIREGDSVYMIDEECVKKKEQQEQIKPQEQKKETEDAVSETWAEETMQELLDFWEEQGVYIRE